MSYLERQRFSRLFLSEKQKDWATAWSLSWLRQWSQACHSDHLAHEKKELAPGDARLGCKAHGPSSIGEVSNSQRGIPQSAHLPAQTQMNSSHPHHVLPTHYLVSESQAEEEDESSGTYPSSPAQHQSLIPDLPFSVPGLDHPPHF